MIQCKCRLKSVLGPGTASKIKGDLHLTTCYINYRPEALSTKTLMVIDFIFWILLWICFPFCSSNADSGFMQILAE